MSNPKIHFESGTYQVELTITSKDGVTKQIKNKVDSKTANHVFELIANPAKTARELSLAVKLRKSHGTCFGCGGPLPPPSPEVKDVGTGFPFCSITCHGNWADRGRTPPPKK